MTTPLLSDFPESKYEEFEEPRESPWPRILAFLRRYKFWMLVPAVLGVLYVAITSTIAGRTYTATALFMPQSRQQPSAVSGFAAELGVTVASGDASQSPLFYVDLLRSRDILGMVVDASYAIPTDKGVRRGTLIQFFRIKEKEKRAARELAVRRLGERIGTSYSPKTGVVTLRVTANNPVLASLITEKLLLEVNRFNVERRQSEAGAERRFTDGRLAEARAELRAVEERFQSFLMTNREIGSSARLRFEHDRMTREIMNRQQIYNLLAQSSENARIDEIRATPVVTTIQPPEPPVFPNPRGRLRRAILWFIFGSLLGAGAAFLHSRIGAFRKTHPTLSGV